MEISDRDKRDREATALLLLLLLRHQEELKRLLGNPPDVANVPDEFWNRVRTETEQTLNPILLLVFIASAAAHDASGPEQADAAFREGSAWAASQARDVAEAYTQTSRDLLGKDSADWQARQAQSEQISAGEIDERTAAIFGTVRATRLASDAVTAAQTRGGEWAVSEYSSLSDNDTWHTIGDDRVCPVCEPLDGQIRSVWSTMFPDGPPAHPLCRCAINYANFKGLNSEKQYA